MKTVCAWCARLLQDGPPYPVSHGICKECERRTFGHLYEVTEGDDAPLPKAS